MKIIKNVKKSLVDFRSVMSKNMQILKKVNGFLKPIDPLMIRLSWVGAFFGGLTSLGAFAVIGGLLHKTAAGYLAEGSFSAQMIVFAITVIAAYMTANIFFQGFTSLRKEIFSDKLGYRLEQQTIDKLTSLDVGRLSDPEFLALKEAAETRGQSAIGSLFRIQLNTISAIVGVVASTGIIGFLDPFLIIITIIPVIPGTIKSIIVERKRRQIWEDNHLVRRKKREYEWVISDKDSLVQVKLFRFTNYMRGRFEFFLNELRKTDLWINWFDFKSNTTIRALEVVAVIIAMIYLGRGLVDGELGFGKIFFITGCMRTFGQSLFGLSSVFVDLSSECRDYEYLEKFLEATPLIDERDARECRFETPPRISLQNVSFAYPRQTNRLALRKCSLIIEPGEKVALVGKNGSGKTTIVRLMTKVYVPNEGEVRINDLSTREILQESWLDHVLYVTQDSQIWDFSIMEAVTGSNSDQVDMSRLLRSAKISGAEEFIKDLPLGFETQIGEDWPGGVGFSSGQLQRLKLTAAFYRLLSPNVHIGLFDEPMAHCDTQTRERFYRSLNGVPGKTIIVVAHDPLYLHHFERVVVIDDGSVIHDLRGQQDIKRYREEIAMSLSEDLK